MTWVSAGKKRYSFVCAIFFFVISMDYLKHGQICCIKRLKFNGLFSHWQACSSGNWEIVFCKSLPSEWECLFPVFHICNNIMAQDIAFLISEFISWFAAVWLDVCKAGNVLLVILVHFMICSFSLFVLVKYLSKKWQFKLRGIEDGSPTKSLPQMLTSRAPIVSCLRIRVLGIITCMLTCVFRVLVYCRLPCLKCV